jgi:hypothetical protein
VSDVAGQTVTTAARLGLKAGNTVGESGYDDDVDHDLRDAIADLIESELLDDDADEVAAVEGEVTPDNAIIVTGFRESLRSAQAIKENADTIVDSVTAEDIGALPDRSVTETLQRIPGISINRFSAGVDPDHFSAEGAGVVGRSF